MREYEIKYTTPDMAIGCRVRTNAGLIQMNTLIKEEVNRLRERNEFLTVEDMVTGLISNVKAVKIVGFTVKEIREKEIDAEDMDDDDTEETL